MIIVLQPYQTTAAKSSHCHAKYQVGAVKTGVCNYLYGRDVKATGKFCAGGVVDACQVIILERVVINVVTVVVIVMLLVILLRVVEMFVSC